MVKPVPGKGPVILMSGQPAGLQVPFENTDGMPAGRQTSRQRHAHQPATDNADLHQEILQEFAADQLFLPADILAGRLTDILRCQSMVLRSPSSRLTADFTPRILAHLETSGTRRLTSSYFFPVNDS